MVYLSSIISHSVVLCLLCRLSVGISAILGEWASRVLTGLVAKGFDSIARLGSHRRTHKSLLEWVVHTCPAGLDAKQANYCCYL